MNAAKRSSVLDLTEDLREIARLAVQPGGVDELLGRALEYLEPVIPYDLAAVLELRDDHLRVRCARGKLANDRVRAHEISLAAFPSVRSAIETRSARVLLERDHAEGEGDPYDGVLDLPHGHSCMVVPLFAGDRTLGAMTFDRQVCGRYEPAIVNLAGICGQLLALAMAAAEQAAVLDRLRVGLQEHNEILRSEAREHSAVALLEQSQSAAMQRVLRLAHQVAVTDTPVLIQGETGSGKEVLAEAIHEWSARCARPFLKLNCAAIPEQLVESELFGHTKGAFSGATQARAGRFVTANGGTLLLDEVGEMPLGAQAKLLRVLQDGTFEPVGSDRTVRVNVRVIAATNADLEDAIGSGRFRQDLFYRLHVFPITVPALRERRDDIPPIATAFLQNLSRRLRRDALVVPADGMRRLIGYNWPGNVRELLNVLERAAILCPPDKASVDIEPLQQRAAPQDSADSLASLEELERRHIERVLEHTGGRIYGTGGAAEILKLKPSTLQSRMAKLGIVRPARQQ
jgi:transcriptional regulator with GAF, ATPase, and Fis domain